MKNRKLIKQWRKLIKIRSKFNAKVYQTDLMHTLSKNDDYLDILYRFVQVTEHLGTALDHIEKLEQKFTEEGIDYETLQKGI